tara:strand:+ start:36 stop:281 length:246 start_codon:yes stop_codon:yes gene_type:complete
MVKQTVRTTVALPEHPSEAVDIAVKDGKAKSRNELIISALDHELAALRRYEIDNAFDGMSADRQYLQEVRRSFEEFLKSDW